MKVGSNSIGHSSRNGSMEKKINEFDFGKKIRTWVGKEKPEENCMKWILRTRKNFRQPCQDKHSPVYFNVGSQLANVKMKAANKCTAAEIRTPSMISWRTVRKKVNVGEQQIANKLTSLISNEIKSLFNKQFRHQAQICRRELSDEMSKFRLLILINVSQSVITIKA